MDPSGASAISSLPIVVTASVIQILEVKSLAVKLRFPNALNKDSLILRATVGLNDDFKPGLIEWFIGDVMDELGSRKEIEYAYKIMEEGSSSHRQMRVYEQTGSLQAVVDNLIKETEEGVL